jgi:hypothetical protein
MAACSYSLIALFLILPSRYAIITYNHLATTQPALLIQYRVPRPGRWCTAMVGILGTVLLDISLAEGTYPPNCYHDPARRRLEYIPESLDCAAHFCSSVFSAETT